MHSVKTVPALLISLPFHLGKDHHIFRCACTPAAREAQSKKCLGQTSYCTTGLLKIHLWLHIQGLIRVYICTYGPLFRVLKGLGSPPLSAHEFHKISRCPGGGHRPARNAGAQPRGGHGGPRLWRAAARGLLLCQHVRSAQPLTSGQDNIDHAQESLSSIFVSIHVSLLRALASQSSGMGIKSRAISYFGIIPAAQNKLERF